MRSALIVVDMQNAFVDPAAGLPVEGADRVVAAVNERVVEAADDGRPVFYTRDVAPIDLPVGDPDGQTDLYPGLNARGTLVDKGPGKNGGFSGFVLTSTAEQVAGEAGDGGLSMLAAHLRRANVEHVTVVGLAADVCVSATARDARRLGYHVTMPLEATAFVHAHADGDEAAIAALTAAGVNITGQRIPG
ncbi:cysteine hydrolase family protein [Solicola gregarius]|uniref:nicotinamidase n=1 Tax=Solicola gregarius TaxID=2908642 RepID=A0AA46TJB6_9ACTN|nr:isochorismatase family cysteine hydrolase [Solicola gregarius]UYM06306.1 cysteine hydrolase [Solicola gregarius]